MTFEDSNDPNYVKDHILGMKDEDTSSKHPNLILKEVLAALQQQDKTVKDFTITVQYKDDDDDEYYSVQKQFIGKSLLDVARNYEQELSEFVQIVKDSDTEHLFEVLIKNDYIFEYFKHSTDKVDDLIPMIVLRLMGIQNDKLIIFNQLIMDILDL